MVLDASSTKSHLGICLFKISEKLLWTRSIGKQIAGCKEQIFLLDAVESGVSLGYLRVLCVLVLSLKVNKGKSLFPGFLGVWVCVCETNMGTDSQMKNESFHLFPPSVLLPMSYGCFSFDSNEACRCLTKISFASLEVCFLQCWKTTAATRGFGYWFLTCVDNVISSVGC